MSESITLTMRVIGSTTCSGASGPHISADLLGEGGRASLTVPEIWTLGAQVKVTFERLEVDE